MPPYLTCTIPPTEAQNVQIHTPLHSHSLELCRAATILHPPDTCLSSQIPHLELQTLVCDCLHVEADCCAEKKQKTHRYSEPDHYHCLICAQCDISADDSNFIFYSQALQCEGDSGRKNDAES